MFSEADLDSLFDKKEEYLTIIKTLGEKAIIKEFDKIFVEFPELCQFAFTAYTPYFNDGDECVFSIGSLHYYLVGEAPEEDDYIYDWPHEAWWSKYGNSNAEWVDKQWEKAAAKGPIHLGMTKLAKRLNENEDIIKAVFGDHQIFYILPGEIKIEEFSHD